MMPCHPLVVDLPSLVAIHPLVVFSTPFEMYPPRVSISPLVAHLALLSPPPLVYFPPLVLSLASVPVLVALPPLVSSFSPLVPYPLVLCAPLASLPPLVAHPPLMLSPRWFAFPRVMRVPC